MESGTITTIGQNVGLNFTNSNGVDPVKISFNLVVSKGGQFNEIYDLFDGSQSNIFQVELFVQLAVSFPVTFTNTKRQEIETHTLQLIQQFVIESTPSPSPYKPSSTSSTLSPFSSSLLCTLLFVLILLISI